MNRLGLKSKNCYFMPRWGKMNADVVIFLNQQLFEDHFEEQSLQQLIDAASLKGVISPVVGMPDIHSGFGLPIGGVMAMDAEHGLVSAGAVGMDINCGVRLLKTNIPASELDKKTTQKLITSIMSRVPGGVGQKSRHAGLVKKHFKKLVETGVPYLVELGYGRQEDILNTEDGGCMTGADILKVSPKAIDRGLQLSTIGGGNHFIEIGVIEKVYDQNAANIYGLSEGYITIMIHTGSRGFGHQVCTDYSKSMKKDAKKYNLSIPNSGLAAVPIRSREGSDYLAAMSCAVNFAYCNRQWITDDLRKAFSEVLGGQDIDYDLGLVYDITHNTARFENIKGKSMLVHRKGATRALPAGHPDNPPAYRETGHPVLIPGSMGSASYVVKAESMVENVFNSVNHGAGRVLSRTAAKQGIAVEDLKNRMKNIIISGSNYKAFLDEAPQAYKNIDHVVDTLADIDMIRKVASLFPVAVIKGEDKN